jgi:hypothetical protein
MIYGNPFVNAACAILILGGFAALLICSPWIGLGVLADRFERERHING